MEQKIHGHDAQSAFEDQQFTEFAILEKLQIKIRNNFKIHKPVLLDKEGKTLARDIADDMYEKMIEEFLQVVGHDRGYNIIGRVVANLGFKTAQQVKKELSDKID